MPKAKPNNDSANDNQPDILVDDIIHNTQEPSNYPSVLPLMSSKEKLKCRSSFTISCPRLTQAS